MADETVGQLLLYTEGVWQPDVIELTALLQRRFPDREVQPVDDEWEQILRAPDAIVPTPIPDEWQSYISVEYVYLVLGWLGGTVSRQLAERAITSVVDAVAGWMKSRRTPDTRQKATLLGPDGKVLKVVEVEPGKAAEPNRRSRRARLRRLPPFPPVSDE
jgi:hypothetical protein